MYKTIRRDKLMREIGKGLYLAKCEGRYTDDYAFDAATNYGKTEWLPARLRQRKTCEHSGREVLDFVEGEMNFQTCDFDNRVR